MKKWACLAFLPVAFGALTLTAAPAANAVNQGPSIGQGRSDLFVSPTGDDHNQGTSGKPFRTLARAQAVVRDLLAHPHGDIVVNVGGGTYRLDAPLHFTTADSPGDNHTVTYQAVAGETPVISGARRVTGWQLSDPAKHIYRAYVGDVQTRQLYVNDVRAVRARSEDNPSGWTQTSSGFTAPDAGMSSWPDAKGVEIVSRTQWKQYRCQVAAVSGTAVQMQQPCWGNSHLGGAWINFGAVSWLENAYELLNSPREWFKSSDGYLYYIPGPGENLETVDVELPTLDSLMVGDGTADAPVHGLSFRGLTFAYATWLQPSTDVGYAPVQAGLHVVGSPAEAGWNGDKIPGAVNFNHDRYVTFDRDVFTHLGADGLNLDTGTQHASVTATRFSDLSGGGIELGGTQVIDHHPRNPGDVTSDNLLTDDVVTTTGLDYPGTPGIFLGYVAHTVVAHNELSELPYTGISMGWGWGSTDAGGNPTYGPGNGGQTIYSTATTNHDNEIRANSIHDVMTELSDGGAVYTMGASPGSIIDGNYVNGDHNVHGVVTYAEALYPDEGSANESWTHNVVTDIAGEWLHVWTPSIHDLEVTGNFTDDPRLTNSGTRIDLRDNSVVLNGAWPAAACSIAGSAGLERGYDGVRGPSHPAPPLC